MTPIHQKNANTAATGERPARGMRHRLRRTARLLVCAGMLVAQACSVTEARPLARHEDMPCSSASIPSLQNK